MRKRSELNISLSSLRRGKIVDSTMNGRVNGCGEEGEMCFKCGGMEFKWEYGKIVSAWVRNCRGILKSIEGLRT